MNKAIFKRAAIMVALTTMVSGSAYAVVTAKLGQAMPDSHPQSRTTVKFAELVEKHTNGNVKVNVYNNAVLGSDEKMLQAVQTGTQEFYTGTLAPLSMRIKELQVWDLPFMFANNKEVYKVLDGAANQKIFDQLPAAGLVGLKWGGIGFRNLSNSKRPVTKLEDINGLKIRVMNNPLAIDTWKALGANAVGMAYSEVFTALEVRAIDGQENPLVHMYTNNLQEVQKYISLTNHVYTAVAIVASKKFMDSLSEADREGIKKAAHEAVMLYRQWLEEADRDVIEKFRKAGVQVDEISPAELVRIQEKVKPVVAKFTPRIGEEFMKEFVAEIEAARKEN